MSAPQPTPQPAASDEAPASAVPAVFDAQLLQGSWQVGPGRGDQPEWFRSGSPELAAALAPAGGNIMTSSYSISQNRDTASAAAGTATKVSRGPIDAPEHRSGGYVISGNRLSLHWSLRDGQTIDETEVLELREPAAANRFAWRSVQ